MSNAEGAMRVEFSRHNSCCLDGTYTAEPGEYRSTSGSFVCDDFLTGYHVGVWNSRMLRFSGSSIPEAHFSDGVPVAAYAKFVYDFDKGDN